MELCIKTEGGHCPQCCGECFNPCFNGTMYKNLFFIPISFYSWFVSILVLMELCIKTWENQNGKCIYCQCFNPCFNGTMYKNGLNDEEWNWLVSVSILVLMELCIKTHHYLWQVGHR